MLPTDGDRLVLRAIREADLPILFEHWRDREAGRMAAFAPKDPDDFGAFEARWRRILGDPNVLARAVVDGDTVVGSVALYPGWRGHPEVTYWIGREHWGRGVATRALRAFLGTILHRPLYGRAAADNAASLRVLAKCGFVRIGLERGFADARGAEVDEVVLRLDGPPPGRP